MVSVFEGEIVQGPARVTSRVPSLDAGVYLLRCDVHPSTMFGALAVGETGS